MKEDVLVQEGIIIPAYELEITASPAGGPGGQHANKTSTRIMVRWNIAHSAALTEEQKARVMAKLAHAITHEGDLIVYYGALRSQHQNREHALKHLAELIRDALLIPKKRKKSGVPKGVKEARLQQKKQKSALKRGRVKKFEE